jgi:VanZ family protein
MSANGTGTRFRKLSLVVLGVYWCALFAGTHAPTVPAVPLGPSDKLLHAASYAVLALLLAWAWSVHRPFAGGGWLAVLAIVFLYGALDEITQIPVGRQADVADWIADAAGAIMGVAVFTIAQAIVRPRA